jgi:hypothetical protein
MSERGALFIIDNLRITLIAQVIAHPTGQAFGPTVAFGILRTRIEPRFWEPYSQ